MARESIPTKPLAFAWKVSEPYRGWLLLALVFVVVANVANAGTAYALKLIIDSATAFANFGTGTLTGILMLIMAYPALRLVEVIGYRVTSMGMHSVTVSLRTRAYRLLLGHLTLHSSSYFNDRFAGTIAGKINHIGGNMSRLANDIVWSYFGLLVSLVTAFVIVSTASVALATAFVAALLILIPLNYYITKPQKELSAKGMQTMNVLRGQIVDTVTNILAVRHNAQRKHELARLDESIVNHQRADVASDLFMEKIVLINGIIIIFFIAGLLFGAFWLWSEGSITLGDFIMISSISTSVMWGISNIGRTMNGFLEIYGETNDALKEILRPVEIADRDGARTLSVRHGTVEFDGVEFKYKEAGDAVFSNFSLLIPAGQRVGLVGVSGSGKSSLVRLILRDHDVSGGAIRIDGHDVRSVTQDSLHRAIAIVPQEPMLFHRSLKENIAYGRPEASNEEIVEAARKAQIHEFINSLPDKYETLVGERGVKLSGGQRQRVAIARALLKASPILILDEATSSLDSESESEIQKALHELMQGKTVIAIAHRLSTIREMDRIIVLSRGVIIEDGSHEELLQREGTYARLWKHQTDGFITDD